LLLLLLLLPALCALGLQLTFTKPHILLLDEPSNHLDIDAVDALIEGLALFKGGVLMVGARA
jgi:ATPase subunit of ABC transporter with duplicated ATPase domains